MQFNYPNNTESRFTGIAIKCGTRMKIREENVCVGRKEAFNYQDYSTSVVDESVEK